MTNDGNGKKPILSRSVVESLDTLHKAIILVLESRGEVTIKEA
jgi:hypothetical protein